MTIVVTGGHITPALAVISELQEKYPSWKIVFIGRKNAFEGSAVISEEYRIIADLKIPFVPLTAGRISRLLNVWSLISFIKIPFGFINALYILSKYKPNCIISFGGYIGLPVVVSGALLGIPSIIHEQTAVPGLANRLAGIFAKRICVTDASVQSRFPKGKTIVTGLPMRDSLFHPPQKSTMPIPLTRPILYITGGATGSKSVNELLYPIIGKLVCNYTVVHQVGRGNLSRAKSVRQNVRGDKRKYYVVIPYADLLDHAWILSHTKLMIGRSGANTVSELRALGIPAVFIPLPWSGGNEQYENASLYEKTGSAVIINQHTATSKEIYETVSQVIKSYDTYKDAARSVAKKALDRNASSLLVLLVHDLVAK